MQVLRLLRHQAVTALTSRRFGALSQEKFKYVGGVQ